MRVMIQGESRMLVGEKPVERSRSVRTERTGQRVFSVMVGRGQRNLFVSLAFILHPSEQTGTHLDRGRLFWSGYDLLWPSLSRLISAHDDQTRM
jgi:hypothetical protein